LVDTSTGERIYLATPELGAVLDEINTNGIESSPDSYFSGITVTDTSLPHADYGTGTITVGGQTANVYTWKDRTSDAVVAVVTVPNVGALAFSGGTAPLSNLPTGTYTYVGTEVVSPRLNLSPVVGTFSMTADFTNKLASYSGVTANTTMVVNNMAINTSTGDFAGSNGTFTYNNNSQSATLYGSFSGDGATGVAGVYHTNDAAGTYAGGFIGHKQ